MVVSREDSSVSLIFDAKDREDLCLVEAMDVFYKSGYGVNRSNDGFIYCLGGSKQILTLAGLLAVAGRSRLFMLDIHGVGLFTRTN